MDRESTPMMAAPPPAILGRFLQVARKTGEIVQEFPIDGERMTIGREPEHNIRLYFQDISKLHAEIVFDLTTGQAALHVHGSNGLDHASEDGAFQHLKPPTVVPLGHKDRIVMRKRLFQFEYATEGEQTIAQYSPPPADRPGTPVATHVAASPARYASPAVPRRARGRMSLIPKGKTFVPLTPAKRRHSVLAEDASHLTTVSRSAIKRSALSDARHPPEQEQPIEVEIEVAEGENGDMIYLESHEEEEEVEEDSSTAMEEASSPTPAPAPMSTPTKVSTKVAMSTPKGPINLHKALLVRSARKAWQETRSPTIDDAVEDGMVQTRRRSSSRSRRSSAASFHEESEIPTTTADGEQELGARMPAETAERGRSEVAEAEPDNDADGHESDGDSFEADRSLDIVAGSEDLRDDSETEYIADHDEDVEMAESNDERFEMPTEADAMDDVSGADCPEEDAEESAEHTPIMSRLLSRFYTPQVKRPVGGPRPSLAAIGGGPARRSSMAAPATPQSQLMFGAATPRSGMMGKPSRRIVVPEPSEVASDTQEEEVRVDIKVMQTPRRSDSEAAAREEARKRRQSLATPRPLPLPEPGMFRTPVVQSRPLFATEHPALMPSTPESEHAAESPTPIFPLVHRPVTPRVAPPSALKAARAGASSFSRPERRATVGFALPSTPAQTARNPFSSTVVKPGTRFAPPTPRFVRPADDNSMEDIDEDENPMDTTPLSRTPAPVVEPEEHVVASPSIYLSLPAISMHQVSPSRDSDVEQRYFSQDGDDSDAEASFNSSPDVAENAPIGQEDVSPSTPTNLGLNHLFSEKQAPKTPYMNDIRSLYPVLPEQVPKTPSFVGVRSMFAEPAVEPATPSFKGMRELFRGPVSTLPPQTPGMDGLADMFPEEDDPLAMGSEDDILGRGESVRSEDEVTDEEGEAEEDEAGDSSVIIAVQAPGPATTKPLTHKSSIPTLKKTTRTAAPAPAPAKAPARPVGRPRKVEATEASTVASSKAVAKPPTTAKTTTTRATKSTARTAAAQVPEATAVTGTKPARARTAAAPSTSTVESQKASLSNIPAPKARTTRTKKVLGEADEQGTASHSSRAASEVSETAAKSTRAKRPAATTSTTAARAKQATSTDEPKPTAAKRSRTAVSKEEKENDAPAAAEPAAKPKRTAASTAVKKAPATRARKATEELAGNVAETVPVARATRSRK